MKDIIKNRINYCIDNFYENANMIINSFEPTNSSLYLFTNNIDNNPTFYNIFPDYQIYVTNFSIYLEKIYLVANEKKQYNKILIFNNIETNILDSISYFNLILDYLNNLNITILIYQTNNNTRYLSEKINYIIPHNMTITFGKKYALIFCNTINWKNFMEKYNNKLILFQKNEKWEEKFLDGNINYSKFKYPIIDSLNGCDIL